MSRLNKERQIKLEPKRMEAAQIALTKLGYSLIVDTTKIMFLHKAERIIFFPYSGWHTGKSIKDGREIGRASCRERV